MITSNNPTQEAPLDDPDTNNATFIGWTELDRGNYWPADYLIPQKRAYYRQLDRYNSGLQNGPLHQNRRYESFWLHREEVFTLGSQLEMEEWIQRRASRLLTGHMRLELGLETTLVLISLCGYFLHDSPNERKCHPQTNEDDFDDRIDQMLTDLDIRRADYDKTYRKIQRIDKRGEKKRTKVRDKYEIDLQSHQSWREVNSDHGDGWL
jgi:hypothetical protein